MNNVENQKENVEINQEVEKTEAYKVETKEQEVKGGTIKVAQVTGYQGELTQTYINQSLEKIVELYDNEDYTEVSIDYDITKMDEELLSVVYKGTAKYAGGRDINIKVAVNIDMKSSNEITYDNYVKDDETVRKILKEKKEDFEAEGIRIYFKDENVVFYYMPLDDMAEEFEEISVPKEELKDLVNTEFGEHPAS